MSSLATGGVELGVREAIRTAKGLYVRPQARIVTMSKSYFAGSAEVAIGWRFRSSGNPGKSATQWL